METPTEHDRVSDLFLRVVDLPKGEQDQILNAPDISACLRESVHRLLEADAQNLKTPFLRPGPIRPVVSGPDPLVGKMLGNYRIMSVLGQGGVGIVYLGYSQALSRKVAIKVIRAGYRSSDALTRLKREARTLAGLSHTHIAKVIEIGESSDGPAHFVMEYIDGRPLDEFCDADCLTLEARLRLFLKVLAAVQYAHENGVIHRDLKPSNILVNPQGEPIIVDFGTAQLTIAGLTAQEFYVPTMPAEAMLTLDYASPEQYQRAQGTGNRTGPFTDIYALGVVAYELLCGVRPTYLDAASIDQRRKVLSPYAPEVLPPSISINGTIVEWTQGVPHLVTAEERCQRRGATIGAIRRTLRGDLDTVILKALRKAWQERYQFCHEFRIDLESYLEGKPIKARPRGFLDRAKQQLRRHRWRIVVILMVVIGTAFPIASIVSASRRQHIITSLANTGFTWNDTGRAIEVDSDTGKTIRDLSSLAAGLQWLHPTFINLKGCDKLENVDALRDSASLKKVILASCLNLKNVDGMRGLPSVEIVSLNACGAINNLDALRGLPIRELDISFCGSLRNVDGLKGMTTLEYLNLNYCVGLTSLGPIPQLTSLKALELQGCSWISEPDLAMIKRSLPHTRIRLPDGKLWLSGTTGPTEPWRPVE